MIVFALKKIEINWLCITLSTNLLWIAPCVSALGFSFVFDIIVAIQLSIFLCFEGSYWTPFLTLWGLGQAQAWLGFVSCGCTYLYFLFLCLFICPSVCPSLRFFCIFIFFVVSLFEGCKHAYVSSLAAPLFGSPGDNPSFLEFIH